MTAAVLHPVTPAAVRASRFACPAPPAPPRPPGDRPRYALSIRVHRGYRRVDGRLSVRFTPNLDTRRLVFRLWPNGPRQLREGARLAVADITVDGDPVAAHRPDATTLVLRRRIRRGGSVTVRLTWRLRVPRTGNDRIARFRSGVRLGSFFPILPWDPRRGWVTDAPTRQIAETSTTPTADFDIRVSVPPGARAFVTGSPVGRDHWHARAVRDVAVAAGRFRVATGIARAPRPVTVTVAAAGRAQVPRDVLTVTLRALRSLARMYGSYPWASYTVVATPDLDAEGIEYPTLVFIGGASIVTLLVQHETAHQWFYSLVGNNQARDPWLDEALATWAQIDLSGARAGELAPEGPFRHVGARVSYFDRHRRTDYYSQVYAGGVKALASLKSPRRVDCALKLYVARNAYAIAQPRDLLAALDRFIPGAATRLRRFGIHG